jgi:hypothetical protein
MVVTEDLKNAAVHYQSWRSDGAERHVFERNAMVPHLFRSVWSIPATDTLNTPLRPNGSPD